MCWITFERITTVSFAWLAVVLGSSHCSNRTTNRRQSEVGPPCATVESLIAKTSSTSKRNCSPNRNCLPSRLPRCRSPEKPIAFGCRPARLQLGLHLPHCECSLRRSLKDEHRSRMRIKPSHDRPRHRRKLSRRRQSGLRRPKACLAPGPRARGSEKAQIPLQPNRKPVLVMTEFWESSRPCSCR